MSEEDACAFISGEQLTVRGAEQQLLLRPTRKSLAHARRTTAAVTAELGLSFQSRRIQVPMPGRAEALKLDMPVRSLVGVAKYFMRMLGAEHGDPKPMHTEAGERVFSHPMWGDYAIAEVAKLRRVHPRAFPLFLRFGHDATELSREQTTEPFYVSCMNLPLKDLRARRCGWMVGAYLAQLPDSELRGLSDAQKTAARRAVWEASLRAIFSEFLPVRLGLV